LRVGVLYSHNAALLSAYENINYFAAVAHDTQDTLAAICRDQQWVRSYFDANRAALRKSFEALAPILREAHIPFVQVTRNSLWIALHKCHDRHIFKFRISLHVISQLLACLFGWISAHFFRISNHPILHQLLIHSSVNAC
jgi:hypothetical protein